MRPASTARDLEEVEHHLVEALDLADHHLESLLRSLGQLVAPAVEHLDRGRQGGEGERGSWLTSEAKRASRSMRLWTASAMSLNESTSRSRSGSGSGSSRVSKPPGYSLAAPATRESGRSSRRLV